MKKKRNKGLLESLNLEQDLDMGYGKGGLFGLGQKVYKKGGKMVKKMNRSRVKQTGSRKSLKLDRLRKAKAPGRRISKSGNRYRETRRNRSDVRGKRI